MNNKGGNYFVFGGCLRSELEFPDLSPADQDRRPDWEIRLDGSDAPEPLELRGTRWIAPDWVFKLHRIEGGLLLEYGGTGSFAILSGGREIVWHVGTRPEDPEVRLEMARAILLGPVMALALQQSGILCLHGSAVTIGGDAVAFLAPKHHGKSTLALALTAAGAQLLTDDLVAIRPGPVPMALPGVHSVRVMEDVAERLRTRFAQATLKFGFKTTVTGLPPTDLAWKAAPLSALYLLESWLELDDGVALTRESLSAARSAASIAREKKLTDELIGLADAGSMLESIAAVTAAVPVYRLRILRQLERRPEVVREIMAWSGATAVPRGD